MELVPIIPEEKWQQFTTMDPMEAEGVTLHNTHNELSARECIDEMIASTTPHAAHLFIDESEVLLALPLEFGCWHTGKARDFGNMSTIAIEICRSMSEPDVYNAAEGRAMQFVKKNFSHLPIYFHTDFLATSRCPHRIYEDNSDKRTFMLKYNLTEGA